MITDVGISANCCGLTPLNTQQKCFDRRQQGVNHIISDSAGSICLCVSLPLELYQRDLSDLSTPKLPARIFLTVFLGFQMDTFHPKEIYSPLSVCETF